MVEKIGLEAVLEDENFTKGLAKYVKGVNTANTTTTKASTSMSKRWTSLGKGILSFAGTVSKALVTGIGAGVAALGAITVASTKTAISFESAFAGVIKTTDGLTDEFGNLTESGEALQQNFRDLAQDVPLVVEELLEIGELGGQLGVARDDLISFTEAIAAMGVTTNLSTEEAATGFAQIANIMGTVEREGSDAFEKLGSSIVALGNNSATTERDILSFGQRIAGAGKIAGLTEADIFGIGAAFASVGVESERGGTAVQKVLNNITAAVSTGSDKVQDFAMVAGFESAEAFATAWETDAADAFTDFVGGLGNAGNDAIGILEDLELTDQRLVGAFLSVAGAGDVLGESIALSNEAWDENTALTKEAQQRYATTESQLILFKNQIKDVGISIGSVLLPFLNEMIKVAGPIIREYGDKLVPVFENVAEWLGKNLPIAINTVKDFWKNELLPILEQTWSFIQENIIPIFEDVAMWLGENLPKAIAFVTEHWDEFKAALIAIGAVLAGAGIVAAIASVAASIAALLNPITLIVAAIGILAAAWAGDWGGMRTAITAWWEETGKPIFEKVVEWLQVNIPKAIETVKTWWDSEFIPAMQRTWTYIQENIIPIFQTIWDWLSTEIPAAIQTASDFWENILKPALSLVWDFIVTDLKPTLDVLADFLSTVFTNAVEGIADVWENTLKPALNTVWEFIRDNLRPIFEGLVDFWNNTFKPGFEEIDFLETLESALEGLKGPLQSIRDFLQGIINKIKKLNSMSVKNFGKDDGGGGGGGGGGSGGDLGSGNNPVMKAIGFPVNEFNNLARSVGKMGSLSTPSPQMVSSPISNSITNNNQRTVININGGTNVDQIRFIVEQVVNEKMVLNS